MSIKILDKLVNEEIKIKLSNKPLETVEILKIIIPIEESQILGLISQEHYDHLAIEQIVEIIKNTSNIHTLKIYKVIDRISEVKNEERSLKFYSNMKIITRKDKLERILKK